MRTKSWLVALLGFLFLMSVVSCEEQEQELPEIDILEKTKLEIAEFMKSKGFVNFDTTKGRVSLGNQNREEVREEIYQIIKANGFTRDHDLSRYENILSPPIRITNDRI